jgi:glutaminase
VTPTTTSARPQPDLPDHAADHISAGLADLLITACRQHGGRVADYIPELATADPNRFGIAMTSVLGRSYRAGDHTAFSIQSISKPFVYAMVLDALGLEEVANNVGFEPSGEPFNAISLEPDTGRPDNPMINAGAIVISSMVPGADVEHQGHNVQAVLSAFAGRDLHLDDAVLASETATGDRNRALAYLALAAGRLATPVDHAIEVYFRQCSLEVTVEDLAIMGSTLAHGGINPVTGDRVVSEPAARHTLSMMTSCGMYDYSGEWMVRVGLPAKSGVGGGIVAILPGQFGIGVHSAPLDQRGNSVRGVEALTELSDHFGMHLLRHPRSPLSPIAETSDVDGVHTVIVRGELDFVSTEQLVHHLTDHCASATPGTVRVDLSAVTRARPITGRLLNATADDLRVVGWEFQMLDSACLLSPA